METSHKNILRHLRKEIIADLDVDNGIISPLKTEFILNDRDVERINNGADKKERASILLDILPGYLIIDIYYLIFTHCIVYKRVSFLPFSFYFDIILYNDVK